MCYVSVEEGHNTIYCTLVPVLFPHYPIASPGDPKPFPYSTLSGEILEAGDETIILGHSKFAYILWHPSITIVNYVRTDHEEFFIASFPRDPLP